MVQTCPVCMEEDDLGDHSPQRLIGCGHQLCLSCIKILAADGHLSCPICLSIYYVSYESNDIWEPVMPINVQKPMCGVHKSVEASWFCSKHLQMRCEDCRFLTEECDCQQIGTSESLVKVQLLRGLLECYEATEPWNRLNFIEDLSIETLNQVFLKAEREANILHCDTCLGRHYRWIELFRLSLYCTPCKLMKKDQESIIEVASDQALINILSEYSCTLAKKISCRALDKTALTFIKEKPSEASEMMKGVSYLSILSKRGWLDKDSGIICPTCIRWLTASEQIKILPCKAARHVLCASCLALQGRAISCPIDGMSYMCSPADLKCYTFSETPQEMLKGDYRLERRAIQEEASLTLAKKEIPMPVFIPSPSYAEVKAIDRFSQLFLCSSSEINQISNERRSFARSWQYQPNTNQIEVVSFSVNVDVRLLGIGVGNAVRKAESLEVDWVRVMSSFGTFTPLCNVSLLSSPSQILTYLYFSEPISLPSFTPLTLTLKLKSSNPSKSVTELYHGKRMERTEQDNPVKWEWIRNRRQPGNENDPQGNFQGAILRVIFAEVK